MKPALTNSCGKPLNPGVAWPSGPPWNSTTIGHGSPVAELLRGALCGISHEHRDLRAVARGIALEPGDGELRGVDLGRGGQRPLGEIAGLPVDDEAGARRLARIDADDGEATVAAQGANRHGRRIGGHGQLEFGHRAGIVDANALIPLVVDAQIQPGLGFVEIEVRDVHRHSGVIGVSSPPAFQRYSRRNSPSLLVSTRNSPGDGAHRPTWYSVFSF